MDFAPLVEKRRARLSELEDAMGDPTFFDDQRKATELTREHTRIKELLAMWDEQAEVQKQIAENRELLGEDDPEIVEMAEMEIPDLEKRQEQLEANIQYSLLPRDPTEDRDAIFEIRAGTGGDEASLFAGDLLRMYQRHAETRGWKLETLESAPSDVGGFKEVTVKISGEEVFRFLKYESGVHRVQRVPNTETQGRIHTSTATVAVMPEAEDVDVQLKPDDLRIEVCRAGGAGGQHVNRTESAVQVFHLPTGVMVRCEDGRSQTKNKEKALMILRSKLLEKQQQDQAAEYSEKRRNLIGSGGREEKIRTYNFPQNRITDHRIGLTVYNLDQVLEGQINELTENLQAAEIADRLEELEASA